MSENITYDINIHFINIINNIIKRQTPELVKNLSIKENLNEKSLHNCVKRFNEDYDINKCKD